MKSTDYSLIGNQAAVLYIGGWFVHSGEYGLIFAEDQQVALLSVAKVKMNTFFPAQALNEKQVALGILDAVFAFGIRLPETEVVGIALNAMFFQNLGNNLWHTQLLKDPLIDAVCQVGQAWHQCQVVMAQAFTGVALGHAVYLPMNTCAAVVKGQKSRFVEQAFDVQIGPLANQFHVERERAADGFTASKRKYL